MNKKDLSIKYRPFKWEEIVGQDKVISILKDQVITGSFSNAYIFAGKSGIGKTTIARLFYLAINCEKKEINPCLECIPCKNVKFSLIEVDGATNRGIDNVRELQKNMYYKRFGTYTCILVDECHMLSIPAWNALLKSIEEPPEHVIWIFCTTELHKIPKTIKTRCQIYRLNPIRWTDIHKRIKQIAKKENIQLSDNTLWEIAQNADNNIRQAIHLLEKYALSGEVDSIEKISNFLESLEKMDIKELWKIFDSWNENYDSIEHFINTLKYDLMNCLKLKLGLKVNASPYKIKKYQEVNISKEKLEKAFNTIIEIEQKIKGVYDYNSLFLKGLLELKEEQ